MIYPVTEKEETIKKGALPHSVTRQHPQHKGYMIQMSNTMGCRTDNAWFVFKQDLFSSRSDREQRLIEETRKQKAETKSQKEGSSRK